MTVRDSRYLAIRHLDDSQKQELRVAAAVERVSMSELAARLILAGLREKVK
jgi:plasmid stability protein